MRDTPPYRATPFRDSIAEGGIAPICLIFIGYRGSIAEIPLLRGEGGISPLLRIYSKGGNAQKRGRGVSHPIYEFSPRSVFEGLPCPWNGHSTKFDLTAPMANPSLKSQALPSKVIQLEAPKQFLPRSACVHAQLQLFMQLQGLICNWRLWAPIQVEQNNISVQGQYAEKVSLSIFAWKLSLVQSH